jgi:hypothetical protein
VCIDCGDELGALSRVRDGGYGMRRTVDAAHGACELSGEAASAAAGSSTRGTTPE